MKEEVLAAVMFFIRFIEKSESFPRDQLENFKSHLTQLLMERFDKHWFPELPTKGQGYRCIRINGVSPTDLCLELAASKCGLSYNDLKLPTELTVWVDPSEVCYRLGESEGSYCTLATFPTSDGLSTMSGRSSTGSLSLSSSCSSSSSESGTPTPSPPTTPSQHDKRVAMRGVAHHQKLTNHQRHGSDFPINPKFRNHQAQNNVLPTSLRMKASPREMHYYNQNRPMYRCDGPPYPLTPAFYRNMNYNRSHYKNILRV